MNKPELVVPAGSLEKQNYAFAYGADAVYAGMPQYSLRARENEFDEESLIHGINKAHQLGRKFYVTANLLSHNRKIPTFLKKIDPIIQAKPDALIMADPGLIDLIKNKYPEIEIHLSVQANTMNWASVQHWSKQGIKRVIMSREVSIDEMKEIKQRVPEMEIEAFVHGAICMAHSGRCLLSSYFNYRDANQGICTNACRWSYRIYQTEKYYLEECERPGELMRIDEDEYGTYILNAKDLMAIEYLDQMIKAGIDSFKIEGRTKSLYYLSVATKAYRSAIDDLCHGKPLSPQYVEDLKKIHHRGYTAGFLTQQRDDELQNYQSGNSDQFTQEFVGLVIEWAQDKILVMPKGKLCVGDEVELMRPCMSSVHFKVESMTLNNGKSVDSIHGGTDQKAWIPFSGNEVPVYSLLSKKLERSKPVNGP